MLAYRDSPLETWSEPGTLNPKPWVRPKSSTVTDEVLSEAMSPSVNAEGWRAKTPLDLTVIVPETLASS